MIWHQLVVLSLASCIYVECSRILFLAPVAIKSHMQFFSGITKALTDNGHEVTMLMPFSRGQPHVKEIVINVTDFGGFIKDPFKNGISTTNNMLQNWSPLCLEALATKEAQELKEKKFDLVFLSIALNDCFLGIIHDMKVPYIWALTTGIIGSYSSELGGSPYFSSFVPHLFTKKATTAPDGLGFLDRALGSLVLDTMGKIATSYYLDGVDKDCRKAGLCAADMPSLYELRMNASMVFINSIQSMETVAQPHTPGILHTGGVHLRSAQALPQELEEWVQASGDAGFIYFSLGSVVRPSEMPDETLRIILTVLGSLQQCVLWKWDQDSIENLPANIRLAKWLPQQDILGHEKIRVFITHGGLHSTQEAQYHSCPVISIPLFFDQHMNMAAAESQGWAHILSWDNFTEESLRGAVDHALNDD
ncbi:unnamed protein product, partial [Meganyctiphanes norvegica]